MSDPGIGDSPIISLTSPAADKVRSLMADKNLVGYGLRVFVAGGGCSGFQYGMAFENNPQKEDNVIEVHGLRVIIDPISLPYLHGASIDYVDTLMGGGFRIENPNAVSTCGCGNSFRTREGSNESSSGRCGCH